MTNILVITVDNKIWDRDNFYVKVVKSMVRNQPFAIDLNSEGPDLGALGLYDFLQQQATELDYDLSQITVHTANALERHDTITVKYNPPMHLLKHAKDYVIGSLPDRDLMYHFALFVGRSNAQRLKLATHLYRHHSDSTLMTYHFNLKDEFHLHNIGLEDLLQQYGSQDVTHECEFLHKCPVLLEKNQTVKIDKSLPINPAQQLAAKDRELFVSCYGRFFVEIVCESYFSGRTFFPTEKIFRPMLLKTPFIVQGPRYFLHNLKNLGFKTFEDWWDEGYAEDPDAHQVSEIQKVIDCLASKPRAELIDILDDMQQTLEHNYQRAMQLTDRDFHTTNWCVQ